MTEEEFRSDKFIRNELEMAINCNAFHEAVKILVRRRQDNEARVEAMIAIEAIASVRMQNQRVGFDGLLNDLRDLCEPVKLSPPEEKPAYGADEALAKLDALNQE